MSDDKHDLNHLVCQMQALVRGTLVRRAYARLRKEYEELACFLDGFDPQLQQHHNTQTAVQWPTAILCNPRFTSPIKGPESDVIERLAKRQWRKPALSHPQQSPASSSPQVPQHQELPATLPHSSQPSATEPTTSPYNSASFDSCSSEGLLSNVSAVQQSRTEGRASEKDEADDRASCDSRKEISHAEDREERVMEQPVRLSVDGPDVRNLNETDLTIVSSIESSSVHLSSSEDCDDGDDADDNVDDDNDDDDDAGHTYQGSETIEEQSSRRPSKTKDANEKEHSTNDGFRGQLDSDVNGSTERNTSNTVRDSANGQQRNSTEEFNSHPSNTSYPVHSLHDVSLSSSNRHDNHSLIEDLSKQERSSSPNPSVDAERPVAMASHPVTSDIVTMETPPVPQVQVPASEPRSRRDDVVLPEASSTSNNGHPIAPREIQESTTGETDSLSVTSQDSNKEPEATGNLADTGFRDSLMQLHDTSVAADMTSVWTLDQSEIDDYSSRLGADAEKLREMRNSTAMELLWIQQAIESRKNYLRLKSKIGRGEPGSDDG